MGVFEFFCEIHKGYFVLRKFALNYGIKASYYIYKPLLGFASIPIIHTLGLGDFTRILRGFYDPFHSLYPFHLSLLSIILSGVSNGRFRLGDFTRILHSLSLSLSLSPLSSLYHSLWRIQWTFSSWFISKGFLYL